jgi:hypothetical protein
MIILFLSRQISLHLPFWQQLHCGQIPKEQLPMLPIPTVLGCWDGPKGSSTRQVFFFFFHFISPFHNLIVSSQGFDGQAESAANSETGNG